MVVERNVFVWSSTVHGYGLFARKPMKRSDLICLYSGISRKKGESTGDFTCSTNTCDIDSGDVNNYSGRWMNHSCTPNARLVVPIGGLLTCHNKRVGIIVECLQPIYQCEEIFIDYGLTYFLQKKEVDPNYFFGCRDMKVCLLKGGRFLKFKW